MIINLISDFIFLKYAWRSSHLSAVVYKIFTLILHRKICIHCSTGDPGALVHDFPQCFLCLLLPFLIFPTTLHTHLIGRRRREAPSLREGPKIVLITFLGYALHGWFSGRMIIIFISRSASSVGSPAAQVHDSPQRLLWLLCFLVSHSARNHGGRGRELLDLRKRPEAVPGMLVNRPHSVIPSAEALILECLHCSHACCHYPSFPHMTHLLNFLPPKLKQQSTVKELILSSEWDIEYLSVNQSVLGCDEEDEVKVGWFYRKEMGLDLVPKVYEKPEAVASSIHGFVCFWIGMTTLFLDL